LDEVVRATGTAMAAVVGLLSIVANSSFLAYLAIGIVVVTFIHVLVMSTKSW
jgi:hypothetical protein